MHLTLLKNEDWSFAVWLDQESVRGGMTIDELFGQLSRTLEDSVKAKEPITASFETVYRGREYLSPTTDDIARARAQLSCFKGALVEGPAVAEAPK